MSKRTVDSKIRSSYSFSRLTFRQRDLWHGLIETVDDQGRMPGEAAFVRSKVWAYDDVKLEEVQEDLDALINEEMILLYEIGGATYLQIINWWKYQSSANWMGASNYPAPEGWEDRCRYHTKGNKIVTENWGRQGGFSNLHSELHSGLSCAKPCDDVNGDVNGDDDGDVNGDVNGDGDKQNDNNPSLRTELLSIFSEKTSLSTEFLKKEDEDALSRMIKVGISIADLSGGIQFMQDSGFPIVGLKSVVNPAIIEFAKRTKKKKPDEDDYRKYTNNPKYSKFIKNGTEEE